MGLKAAWRGLLGREVRASAAGPLLALHDTGRPALLPRRFDAFAEEGYRKNVVVHRAVNEVARGAAAVPWLLYRQDGARLRQGLLPSLELRRTSRRGEALEELGAHPLLKLLERPNPGMARAAFLEAVIGYLQIAGNAYVEAVAAPDGAPLELWPLRPDRMQVVKGQNGLPAGYIYKVGGVERRWDADPLSGRSAILHLRAFNPLDDWYGLSPIEAAAYGIDQHNEAGKWNTALLQNGARPSGALLYEPAGGGNLDDTQFARIKSEIEEQYSGARNAGRPLLLEGGLKWQELSLSPREMDFLAAKHTAARDIALAFGVPPQLLGIPGDNTYANYQEARLALWEETIVPLLCHLRDAFNAWLVPWFGEGLALDVDLDEVPALTARREKKWDMLLRAYRRGLLTRDEAREALGYAALGEEAKEN